MRCAPTLWYYDGRRHFSEIAINIGRRAGTSLEDIIHYLERDSTYGHFTQAVVYGWYDNELGGYVNKLGDRVVSIAEMM